MRIGVSLSSSLATSDPRVAAGWMIERARAAERVELDSLSLGDHHVMATPYYQNTPMLGRLMAEWGDRPIGCLFLLPLWNPVLVAEHIGTLAALTNSTFIVQTGIGDGATQFRAMNASLRTRGAVLEERIRVIQALLAGVEVDRDPPGHDVAIGLRPHQHVEWWLSAGASHAALARAGRMGDAWYASPNLALAAAEASLPVYVQACTEHDRVPRPILRRDVIVLRDGAVAGRLGEAIISSGYRGLGRDVVAFGSPASVAEQLAPYRDLGFTDIICRCMTVPQREAIETLELLAEVRALLSAT